MKIDIDLGARVLFAADQQIKRNIWTDITEVEGDSVEAFKFQLNKALELGVPLVMGGDFFDSRYPVPAVFEEVRAAIAEFKNKGGFVYGIVGNHDMTSPAWQTIAGVTPLNEKIVRFCGINWLGLDFLVAAEMSERLKTIPEHVSGMIVHQLTKQVMPEVMVNSANFDLEAVPAHVHTVLGGDYHERLDQTFRRVEKPDIRIHYPGSTVFCNWAEIPYKAASLLEIDATGRLSISAIPIPGREFKTFEVNEEAQMAELLAQIANHIPAANNLPKRISAEVWQIKYKSGIDTGVLDAEARLKAVKNPAIILQPVPVAADGVPIEGVPVIPEGQEGVVFTPEQILAAVVDPQRDPEAYQVALRLLGAKDKQVSLREERTRFGL